MSDRILELGKTTSPITVAMIIDPIASIDSGIIGGVCNHNPGVRRFAQIIGSIAISVIEIFVMPYQYKRESLTQDEATRLVNTCQTHTEKLVIWRLLDTGLRVSELAKLENENIDWQGHRLMVYGKGRPYGSQTKRRVIPLSSRVSPCWRDTLRCTTHWAWLPALSRCLSNVWRPALTLAGRSCPTSCVTPLPSPPSRGISLPALQRLLGHDRLTTTEIYLNLSLADVVRELRNGDPSTVFYFIAPGCLSPMSQWSHRTIDTHVAHVLAHGGGDEELLMSLADHMGTCKQLMEMSSGEDMNALRQLLTTAPLPQPQMEE